jgi:hypothetical protein
MSLQEKLISLKLNAALAVKHANGWQRLIDLYGESKATEFYKHLGLNHLETKGFEYEGLTLSREPKEHEKLAVKGIAQAQESSKGAIGKILLDLRGELIADGLKGIKKLKPARYHELTLQASPEIRLSLRDRLIQVFKLGRTLVASEITGQYGIERELSSWYPTIRYNRNKVNRAEDEFEDLDLLTDLTNSRVANDVQARIIAAAQRYALLGQTGNDLLTSITSEITDGSVAYIDRAATGIANRVINIGRSDEAQNRSDEWERVEYSALLDQNVCDPCASFDGESSTDEADLEPAPSPSCLGGDFCRCFHVFITN